MLKKSDFSPPYSLLLSRTKYKPQCPWPTARRSALVWWGASTEMKLFLVAVILLEIKHQEAEGEGGYDLQFPAKSR